jgi:hypothetical protein
MRRGLLLGLLVAAWLALMTGAASAVIYTPPSLTFAPQVAGTQSASQTVQVGGGFCGPDFFDPMTMTIQPGPCFPEPSDIAVSGDFVITGNTCPGAYFTDGPSSRLSCHVDVAFKPGTFGTRQGFLRLISNPSIQGVPLSGTGLVCFKNRKGKRVCSATGPPKKKKKHKKKKR